MKTEKGWYSTCLLCALGALIGTVVSMDIQRRFVLGSYLWPIGAIAGGIFTYIIVDFGRLCSVIAKCCYNIIKWRRTKLWWKTLILTSISTTSFSLSFFICLVLSCHSGKIPENFSWYVVPFMFLMPIPINFFLIDLGMNKEDKIIYEKELSAQIKWSRSFLLWANPIGLLVAVFLGLKLILVSAPSVVKVIIKTLSRVIKSVKRFFVRTLIIGLKWFFVRTSRVLLYVVKVIIKALDRIIKFVRRLVVKTFLFVHSDYRIVVFSGSALGAVAGFLSGCCIMGIIAGFIIGCVEYNIATWLSKRTESPLEK